MPIYASDIAKQRFELRKTTKSKPSFFYEKKRIDRGENLYGKPPAKVQKKIADIIIPHHNRHDMLEVLLRGLNLQLFNIIICCGQPFGYNCNKGAKVAETDNLVFMNDDIIISSEEVLRMVNCLQKWDFVGTSQKVGDNFEKKYFGINLFKRVSGEIFHSITNKKKNSLFPTGFLFAIKKEKWEDLGGFDRRFLTGNEDVDFGLRALAKGLKTKILDMEIKHCESQSSGRFNYVEENEKTFYNIWSQEKLKKVLKNNSENLC
jgi:GT2 family glycosyltransferase